MVLRRIAVADPFAVLRNEMDRHFGAALSTLASPAASACACAFPAINAWQDDQAVHIEAELPGWSMDDIDVSVFGNELTLKSAKHPATPENVTYLRRERFAGTFERTIGLSVEIDAERVEASLKHGVLRVTLPKAASAQPRKVTVKTSA